MLSMSNLMCLRSVAKTDRFILMGYRVDSPVSWISVENVNGAALAFMTLEPLLASI